MTPRAAAFGPREATPKDALDVLLGTRLHFGDIGQIYALALLRLAERLIGIEVECEECEGTGYLDDGLPGHCDRCGNECMCCCSSDSKCFDCRGSGRLEYSRDNVYRMTERIIRQKLGEPATRLPTLWTNSYFVSTVGGSPLAVVKQYIENQKRSER